MAVAATFPSYAAAVPLTACGKSERAAARKGRGVRTALATLAVFGCVLPAQGQSPPDQRQRLATAKRDAAIATRKADDLARRAAAEQDAANKAKAEEAALAARVTAAEATLAAARTRQAIVASLLARQERTLGTAQAPAARLLAALAALARRPAVVAIAQPGSVTDLVHVRAVLGGALPVVRQKTRAVRQQIDRTRALQSNARIAATALRRSRGELEADRVALARLEAAHRARSRALGRGAMSEFDRALALGERARDLVGLLDADDAAQVTAADLATLPGPLPRPLAPGTINPQRLTGVYRLPVRGRLITGLDEISDAGVRSRGLTLAVAPGAPVIAPAAGVVRYARRFRGYGIIVILDHGDGWTTLITGLSRTMAVRGQTVAAQDPIGAAGRGEVPRITVELRRHGRPMDIAALIG